MSTKRQHNSWFLAENIQRNHQPRHIILTLLILLCFSEMFVHERSIVSYDLLIMIYANHALTPKSICFGFRWILRHLILNDKMMVGCSATICLQFFLPFHIRPWLTSISHMFEITRDTLVDNLPGMLWCIQLIILSFLVFRCFNQMKKWYVYAATTFY